MWKFGITWRQYPYLHLLYFNLDENNLDTICPVHKLRCLLLTLARIVTNHRNFALVTPILTRLHLLPVELYCGFKTATLAYKFLHIGFLSYFEPFLSWSSCSDKQDMANLTCNSWHFQLPYLYFTSQSSNCFTFSAPKIWKDVLDIFKMQVQLPPSIKKLRTYLQTPTCHSRPSSLCPPFYDLAILIVIHIHIFNMVTFVCTVQPVIWWELSIIKVLIILD